MFCLALVPTSNARAAGSVIHCTQAGETPKDIAGRYGVSLRSLQRSSRRVRQAMAAAKRRRGGKKGRRKRAAPAQFGADLQVRINAPKRRPETRDMVLRIKRGASLRWVARTWNTRVGLLRCVNDLGPKVVRVRAPPTGKRRRGKRSATTALRRVLIVRLTVPTAKARPIGSPSRGRLVNGERLPEAPGLHVRSPGQAYGANNLISVILRAIAAVNRTFADTHPLVVGHLSHPRGGHLVPHKSHQNGLDVDMGFYFRGNVPHDRFVVARRGNLDTRRTWALIKALLDSHEVQYIFLDTPLQRLLRKRAGADRRGTTRWCRAWLSARDRRLRRAGARPKRHKKGGVERCLDVVFEAKKGGRNPDGMIRAAKGHDDHLHLRVLRRTD